MIRKIVQSGDPVLRERAKPVKKIDKKILDLIVDLRDTLKTQKEPEGVGLAAPQIGKSLRVFLASYSPGATGEIGKGFDRVVINPEILDIGYAKSAEKKTKSKKEILEGCLSLPYYYGPLTRANKVKLKYLNEKGKEMVETFTDFNAQIILHEIDHLEGVLFIDRLLQDKKPLYKVDGDEWEEVELV